MSTVGLLTYSGREGDRKSSLLLTEPDFCWSIITYSFWVQGKNMQSIRFPWGPTTSNYWPSKVILRIILAWSCLPNRMSLPPKQQHLLILWLTHSVNSFDSLTKRCKCWRFSSVWGMMGLWYRRKNFFTFMAYSFFSVSRLNLLKSSQ